MIGGLAILLICQLIGELIAALLQLPVPGPVIGMLLLFCGLLVRGGRQKGFRAAPAKTLDTAADGLLKHLGLMFVPAGTGIVVYLALIRDEWPAITVALVGSTVITLGVTAILMQALMRRNQRTATKKQDTA